MISEAEQLARAEVRLSRMAERLNDEIKRTMPPGGCLIHHNTKLNQFCPEYVRVRFYIVSNYLERVCQTAWRLGFTAPEFEIESGATVTGNRPFIAVRLKNGGAWAQLAHDTDLCAPVR